MLRANSDPRIGLVAVGFSPPDALAPLAGHLDWRHPFLSDEQRTVYRALDLGRAGLGRVYSPRTLATYARARLRGTRLARPVEDTRQLGGDAIIRDGTVVARWRPRTPEDRVPATDLQRAAVRYLPGTGGVR